MKVISLKKIPQSKIIPQAVSVLQTGGLLIYPTETVYGIGADATNPEAVKKLSEYKSRPFGKPYSVAVADQKMAEKYAELNTTAKKLYRQFLPGPLTVISKGKHFTAAGVESETGSLGIRMSSYPLVKQIVKSLGRPITATSANEAYKKKPYQISDILNNISDKKKKLIDLIVDAGRLPKREPSTVIDTTMDDPVALRIGKIKLTKENKILSRSEENTQNFGKEMWQKYEQFAGKRAIVFALEGQLGAGKTQFVKGLARAMGIDTAVTSPTFNLMNHYSLLSTPYSLLHIDVWRIETEKELEDLGFKKIISDKSVIAIEWADKVVNVIRRQNDEAVIIWIKIKYGKSDNERIISWGVK
ncbi:threonylcarbamoyl-AMP synthase [Candidatus Collierbacteria bacterium]|nr:threonylcarbamoyl-AMP synthase [Candidatus Collierbacteria bacterium]